MKANDDACRVRIPSESSALFSSVMDRDEQSKWITVHIPHRVRAAIARLNLKESLLGVAPFIDPERPTVEAEIYWRCATDSIWEGRLAAIRWLIEFVGIKQDGDRKPAVSKPNKSHPEDVWIEHLDGGQRLDHLSDEGAFLANVWKGCSQASSHATNAYDHPSVNEDELCKAITIIVAYLQKTIYEKTGNNIRDYVLQKF